VAPFVVRGTGTAVACWLLVAGCCCWWWLVVVVVVVVVLVLVLVLVLVSWWLVVAAVRGHVLSVVCGWAVALGQVFFNTAVRE
jgi:hypothetical protein